MNIQQALKTGKPLARKNSTRMKGSHDNGFICPDVIACFGLTKEDLLADDWEVEEQFVRLAKSEIVRAIAKIGKEKACRLGYQISGPHGPSSIDSAYGYELIIEYYQSFFEELGFKNENVK